MAGMFLGGQVSLEHQAHAHGITAVLCHVHRGLEGVLELELASLDGDDLHDGQLGDQHLGVLAPETGLLQVPGCAFKVQAIDVTA